jgi:hypothetical protein
VHILKEPLVGFLVLGAAMFALFQLRQENPVYEPETSREIFVTRGDIDALSQSFRNAWRRPPTPAELDRLIEKHIRQEVFYREALALGLDRGDAVIKRHLRRKLEFLLTDLDEPTQPTDAELQAFLEANAESYRLPAVYSLRQAWLDSQDSERAGVVLQSLRNGDLDADSLGRSAIIPADFDAQTTREIERVMGRDFVANLSQLPVGEWHGPIRSGLGLHLIYISERVDGRIPMLAEVRDAVFRDWSAEMRRNVDETRFAALRQRYAIRIERPPGGDGADANPPEFASVGNRH